MAGGYLFGWDSVNEVWVKLQCDADGLLKVDPALLFENPPTEDEAEKGPSSEWAFDHNADESAHHAKYTDAEAIAAAAVYENPPTEDEALKAPTSEWAFDHNANVAAHHAKYTDVEARAAIDDILNSSGYLTKKLYCSYFAIDQLQQFRVRWSAADTRYIDIKSSINNAQLRITGYVVDGAACDTSIAIFYGGGFKLVTHSGNFQSMLDDYLENIPTNGVVNKAPTSNWAYDHDADAAAHHAKYTDLEAQEACNLDGNLYWSTPGVAFDAEDPATDEVSKESDGSVKAVTNSIDLYTQVNLPDGATITEVKVMGNAAAEDKYWYLYRILLTALTRVTVSYALINTASTTIISGIIDNSLYGYFLRCNGMETNDIINGCFIKYTL